MSCFQIILSFVTVKLDGSNDKNGRSCIKLDGLGDFKWSICERRQSEGQKLDSHSNINWAVFLTVCFHTSGSFTFLLFGLCASNKIVAYFDPWQSNINYYITQKTDHFHLVPSTLRSTSGI